MLDIVHAILEWFLPIFVPGDQQVHKTSSMVSGAAESLSVQIPGHDPNSSDPNATGLTGAHFLMVAFALVAVWLVISNLTTRVVEEKRTSFREKRTPGSIDLPLHGIIDDNVDRHIWQENFVPSDLKLKWILERHESDLHHLQKHQIEQDIKYSYLSRKLSRRDRRSSVRRRPDTFLRESGRVPEKLDLHITSDDEDLPIVDQLGKFPTNEERCRCVKTGAVESDKRETERRGNGDEIMEKRNFKDEHVTMSPSAFGQGDVRQDDQLAQKSVASSEQRQGLAQSQEHATRSPPLIQRPRGPVSGTADLFMATKPHFLHSFFGGGVVTGDKSVPTQTPPPTPPPLPRRTKITNDNGVVDSKLVDRFLNRHPETESLESISSGVTTASANPDASRRETALVPESTSPVDPPGPDSAT